MTLAPLPPAPVADRSPGARTAAPTPRGARALRRPARHARDLAPGLLAVAALTAGCLAVGRAAPTVSPLLLGIVVGAALRNTGLVPTAVRAGVTWAARHGLRAGIVLLGLQLSLPAVLALRPGEVALVVVTVAVTFLATRWAGARLGVDRRTALLVATGFSICGAAAVAAMSAAVPARGAGDGARPHDASPAVATAVAMVTVFGSLALVAMPLAQGPLGLDDRQTGVWIGASVHEVAQVVAAASGVSAAALAVAVVVKLARVVLLAPLVAVVGLVERRHAGRAAARPTRRPPLVPLFVLGFLAAVALRGTGLLPDAGLDVAQAAGTALLTAAMLGLGADVHVPTLLRTGGRALALGAVSTAVTTTVSLAGVYLLAA